MDFVFLHGGNHGGWCWDKVADALKDKLGDELGTIVQLDIPGCGSKREVEYEHLDLSDVVTELTDDVRRTVSKDAVFVGHSMAGLVMPEMVALAPELYCGAIFATCCVPTIGASIMETMGTSLHGQNPNEVGWPIDPSTASPEELSKAMFCEDSWPEELVTWLLSETEKDNWPPLLATEKVNRSDTANFIPTAYVTAKRDNILPLDWQHKFAERIGATNNIVEIDAAHELMISHPSELAKAIIDIASSWE